MSDQDTVCKQSKPNKINIHNLQIYFRYLNSGINSDSFFFPRFNFEADAIKDSNVWIELDGPQQLEYKEGDFGGRSFWDVKEGEYTLAFKGFNMNRRILKRKS